ncbi:S-acyl fatty acid synthase thioesterase, medium chain [Tamandua tetradactyla]|uniref:S-acyl fatty acid synthase thioesterase, medium chain n=1 Tax=Tamandua tetradactyla TaxID=48850 RepID=UPI0040545408
MKRNEKIVNCLYPKTDAIFKLICFPWVGGGSFYFAKWGQDIHNSLEAHAIRLAGRESGSEEPFVSDFNYVVDEIAYALLPVIQDKPFAFFGHSMGSYIAFMTAQKLKEKYNQEPVHFFVSSTTPPHSKSKIIIPELKELSEEQLVPLLMEFGGTPNSFINNKELVQQCIPKMMADANLPNNFLFDSTSGSVLSCGLTCFVGSTDIAKDLEAWKDLTSGSFDIYVLPGNHFYVMEPSNESILKNFIREYLELSEFTMN